MTSLRPINISQSQQQQGHISSLCCTANPDGGYSIDRRDFTQVADFEQFQGNYVQTIVAGSAEQPDRPNPEVVLADVQDNFRVEKDFLKSLASRYAHIEAFEAASKLFTDTTERVSQGRIEDSRVFHFMWHRIDEGELTLRWAPENSDHLLLSTDSGRCLNIDLDAVQKPLPGVFAIQQHASVIKSPSTLIMALTKRRIDMAWKSRHPSNTWQAVMSELHQRNDVKPSNLCSLALFEALFRVILQDEDAVITSIERALNEIDVAMASDSTARTHIVFWRVAMGRWRPYLRSMRRFIAQFRRMLQISEIELGGDEVHALNNGGVQRTIGSKKTMLDNIELKQAAALEHCESTFTALMSTMSIMESEKAIKEAEEVTKLTRLAFFFIPLTAVFGIYGMNLKACSRGPLLAYWIY